MGFVDPFDVVAGITAIGLVIQKLGGGGDIAAALSSIISEI
jgi:hypothetical protein